MSADSTSQSISNTTSAPTEPSVEVPIIYEGQFGNFTIEESDRKEVVIYRSGLAVSALCVVAATAAVWMGSAIAPEIATVSYAILWTALGVSLFYIHIYLKALHRTLQVFWLIGGVASLLIGILYPHSLAQTAYGQPLTILGIGFTFAALTGIYFKEAFCFNRLETKLLVFLVPTLLLGHMVGQLPLSAERWMLAAWAALFAIFAFRKVIQPIPPDIGDKSVFEYLKQQKA